MPWSVCDKSCKSPKTSLCVIPPTSALSLLSVYSSRDAIRAAFQNGLIADDPLWLRMVETRNQSTHAYGEPLAEQVYSKLSGYLPLFESLSNSLAKKS